MERNAPVLTQAQGDMHGPSTAATEQPGLWVHTVSQLSWTVSCKSAELLAHGMDANIRHKELGISNLYFFPWLIKLP